MYTHTLHIVNYVFLSRRFVDDESVKSSLHKKAANGFPIKSPKATIATHNAIAGIECIGINPKKKHSSSVKLNVTPSCGNCLYPFVGTTFEESTETLAYALLFVVSTEEEEEEEEEDDISALERAIFVKTSDDGEALDDAPAVSLVQFTDEENNAVVLSCLAINVMVPERDEASACHAAVSYTHLTLPTKRIV